MAPDPPPSRGSPAEERAQANAWGTPFRNPLPGSAPDAPLFPWAPTPTSLQSLPPSPALPHSSKDRHLKILVGFHHVMFQLKAKRLKKKSSEPPLMGLQRRRNNNNKKDAGPVYSEMLIREKRSTSDNCPSSLGCAPENLCVNVVFVIPNTLYIHFRS